MDVVFSRAWFRRHQRSLLFLANCPVTRHAVRDALLIEHGMPLVSLSPFAATWRARDGHLMTEIHITRAFGVRLFTRLRAVWEAMHWFDRCIANPALPALNLGFDSLTTYPDADPETTTVDGVVYRQGHDWSWPVMLESSAGDSIQENSTSYVLVGYTAEYSEDTWADLYRSLFLFDTSLLRTGAVVSAATLSLYGSSKADALSATPDVNVFAATTVSDTALSLADFGTIASTPLCASAVSYANWSSSGYNAFALNAAGLAHIDVDGISRFGAREATHDVGATSPPWAQLVGANLSAYFADDTTAANGKDPKLSITYTPGVTFRPNVQVV